MLLEHFQSTPGLLLLDVNENYHWLLSGDLILISSTLGRWLRKVVTYQVILCWIRSLQVTWKANFRHYGVLVASPVGKCSLRLEVLWRFTRVVVGDQIWAYSCLIIMGNFCRCLWYVPRKGIPKVWEGEVTICGGNLLRGGGETREAWKPLSSREEDLRLLPKPCCNTSNLSVTEKYMAHWQSGVYGHVPSLACALWVSLLKCQEIGCLTT